MLDPRGIQHFLIYRGTVARNHTVRAAVEFRWRAIILSVPPWSLDGAHVHTFRAARREFKFMVS